VFDTGPAEWLDMPQRYVSYGISHRGMYNHYYEDHFGKHSQVRICFCCVCDTIVFIIFFFFIYYHFIIYYLLSFYHLLFIVILSFIIILSFYYFIIFYHFIILSFYHFIILSFL
jgi:hypothetical protein